jgi:hypothetical protein
MRESGRKRTEGKNVRTLVIKTSEVKVEAIVKRNEGRAKP